MKKIFILILIFISQIISATKQVPLPPFTSFSSLLTTSNVEVLSQHIYLNINDRFASGHYTIEYEINVKKDISKEYFLFVNKHSFNLSIHFDDKNVIINNAEIPSNYNDFKEYQFIDDFSNYLNTTDYGESCVKFESTNLEYPKYFYLNQFSFFSTKILKGCHTIKIEFDASPVENRGELRKAKFEYWILSKNHKASTVTMTIKQSDATTYVSSFEEKEISVSLKKMNLKIDEDTQVFIELVPKPNLLAKLLMTISPFGLSLIIIFFCIHIHNRKIYNFRITNPKAKYSSPVIVGSILMPFIWYFALLFSYNLKNYSLGFYKGFQSDNLFFLMILILICPVVLLVYLLIMWQLDLRIYKK